MSPASKDEHRGEERKAILILRGGTGRFCEDGGEGRHTGAGTFGNKEIVLTHS